MTEDTTARVEKLRIRLNVTCKGTLIALTEEGAIVHVPTAQPPGRQITLALECGPGHTTHIPGQVVRSVPLPQHPPAGTEHHVTVRFLDLRRETVASVRRVMEDIGSVRF